MAPVPMRLYTLYLPVAGNDGHAFPEEQLAWARDRIAQFSGGYTVLEKSDGFWIGEDGRVYRDPVLPILIVSPASPQSETFFAQLASQLAVVLGQEAIFIHSAPVTVVEALGQRLAG